MLRNSTSNRANKAPSAFEVIPVCIALAYILYSFHSLELLLLKATENEVCARVMANIATISIGWGILYCVDMRPTAWTFLTGFNLGGALYALGTKICPLATLWWSGKALNDKELAVLMS